MGTGILRGSVADVAPARAATTAPRRRSQRGSLGGSQPHATTLRSAPHCGHRPGAVVAAADHDRAARGWRCRSPSGRRRAARPARYGVVSSSSTSGTSAWYSRALTSSSARASSRQRWHGPMRSTSKREVEEQPAREPREAELRPHPRRLRAVLLRAGRERGDRDGTCCRRWSPGASRSVRRSTCVISGEATRLRCPSREVTRRARARTARRSARCSCSRPRCTAVRNLPRLTSSVARISSA